MTKKLIFNNYKQIKLKNHTNSHNPATDTGTIARDTQIEVPVHMVR